MFRRRTTVLTLATSVAFTSLSIAAEGTTLQMLNNAIAESKSSGKPLLVLGGAPER